MKQIRVKAIFKGQHGSLGYHHGQEYVLTIYSDKDSTEIERADGTGGRCAYESLGAFLTNWDCVRVEHIMTV